jgi:hypothetical protein
MLISMSATTCCGPRNPDNIKLISFLLVETVKNFRLTVAAYKQLQLYRALDQVSIGAIQATSFAYYI